MVLGALSVPETGTETTCVFLIVNHNIITLVLQVKKKKLKSFEVTGLSLNRV